jgi:hypothetical protein
MKRCFCLLLFGALIGAMVAPAFADIQPPGFDDPVNNPTRQKWEPQPMGAPGDPPVPLLPGTQLPPVEVDNPFGPPPVAEPGPTPEGEWVNEWFEGPDGPLIPTWHYIGEPGTTTELNIWVPNSPDPNPVKYLTISSVSDKAISSATNPLVITPAGGGPDQGVTRISSSATQLPNGTWYRYESLYKIEPNPTGEWITLNVIECTNIASIEIKTVCMPVPEPASVIMLGLLGLVAACLYRRS